MTTIPASQLVNVLPNVLSAGGNALVLNGLLLTTSTRVPVGQVLSFPNDGVSVAAYFGAGSNEAIEAGVYFAGFDGSSQKPATILFAQYPQAAVAAYLRGGPFNMTIAQMQALSGSLTVVLDGYAHVISSINLASYSSYSAAAAAIQAAFTNPTEATFTASLGATFTATGSGTNFTTSSVTGVISPGDTITGTGVPANTTIVSQTSGTTGGAGVYVTSNPTTSVAASIIGTSNRLQVTVCATPSIAVGQTLVGAGVTGNPLIASQVSGTTGGVGVYTISGSPLQIASEGMTTAATAPVVTYDSVSGAFVVTSGITGLPSTAAYATGTLSTSLALTLATGAVLSQGAAAAVPGTFMSAITTITQNWASFMTMFDPDGGNGNTIKQAFAAWVNGQNDRYLYVAWDTDASPTTSNNATSSLGNILNASNSSGTCCVYEPSNQHLAAFVCGAIASIDFTATNGRTTMAYRSQTGLVAGVTSATVANNLIANGYNFYGAYATAAQQFLFFQQGSVSGPFEWLDSYVNQIWLNNALQLSLVELLANSNSIPYNPAGYETIKAACRDPIDAAVNFGAIRAGVTLSSSQTSEVNTDAGTNIATTLENQGWYLQVLDAAPQVRQARTSPPMSLWYMDGESVQQMTLNSVLVQ